MAMVVLFFECSIIKKIKNISNGHGWNTHMLQDRGRFPSLFRHLHHPHYLTEYVPFHHALFVPQHCCTTQPSTCGTTCSTYATI